MQIDGNKPALDDDAFAEWSRRLAGPRADAHRAFKEVFDVMHVALISFSWRRYTKSQVMSQDIVQNAMLKLWEIRKTLDPKRSLKSLLYTMVRNLSLNAIRDRHPAQELNPEFMEDRVTQGPDDELDYRMRKQLLYKYISELPQRRQEAFTLSRFEGLTHEEIAGIMGLTARTVNTHITLALRDLRARMASL
ncbi:MAG: RNA polymerase sigma-70 factor [Bacteroidota bacterium]|nr:RNA polymerase sigma-70 factor [Bacteroidota bacterium]